MSVTLRGECQRSSDRVYDFGCRPQAGEGRTDPMGHPLALSKPHWHGSRSARILLTIETWFPHRSFRGTPAVATQPLCRTAVDRGAVLAPPSAHAVGGTPLQGSPRICSGTPISPGPVQRDKASIRPLAHEQHPSESLSRQSSQRSRPLGRVTPARPLQWSVTGAELWDNAILRVRPVDREQSI